MTWYIGLDLGGTNIAAAVVGSGGDVHCRHSVPTQREGGPEQVIDNLVRATQQLVEKAEPSLDQIEAIGVGAPGLIDFATGTVIDCTNLPGFTNVPLCQRLRDRLGPPVLLDNDANAAALGEYWAGVGKQSQLRNMVMLTLGTGVGGGAVVEGQVVRGSHGMGMEAGHMIIFPDRDRIERMSPGSLESYASANAIARRATHAIEAGEASALQGLLQRGPITCEQVYQAAAAGDPLATRITEQAAEALGIACITLVRVFDPQCVVFAGGVIQAGDALFAPVRAAYDHYDWKLPKTDIQLIPAVLDEDAGVVGAAALAWQASQSGATSCNPFFDLPQPTAPEFTS